MKKVLTVPQRKNLLAVFLILLTICALVSVPAIAHADSGTTQESVDIVGGLIERGADIVQTLILTAIGILGAWVANKLASSQHLKSVGAAWDEAVKAAQITIGELQQTVVNDLKAASRDGKLAKDEISQLNKKLVSKTIEKMSKPAYDILVAAAVDVDALISGAGEAFIEEIKRDQLADVIVEAEPILQE